MSTPIITARRNLAQRIANLLRKAGGDELKLTPWQLGQVREAIEQLEEERFALLQLGRSELRDVDYRTKRFSCSECGDEAWLTVTDPRTERGMEDYDLDQREDPERHPAAVDRLLGRRRQRRPAVDQSGGELPGRKVDGRR